MKIKVLSYSEMVHTHKCLVEGQDSPVLVDILVNGDFPEDIDPLSLIDKTFEVEYVYPAVLVAMHVNPTPL